MTAVRDDWQTFHAALLALGFTEQLDQMPTAIAVQANGDTVRVRWAWSPFRGLDHLDVARFPRDDWRATALASVSPFSSTTFALAVLRATCDHDDTTGSAR